MLVTTMKCRRQFLPFWAPTLKRCHQHRNSVINIKKSWPTLSHQHHCHRFLKCINLVKLHALQIRANIYVVYYGIFSKSRLKFVMMEDALQYGTQD